MPDLMDLAKPFLWLALIAFLVGFVSYLTLGGPAQAALQGDRLAAPVSAPVSDDWNFPKRI
jgi:hypothetical protein